MLPLPNWRVPLLFAILTTLVVLISGLQLISGTKADVELQSQQTLSELSKQNARAVCAAVELQLEKLDALSNIIGMQETFTLDFTMQVLRAENRRSPLKRLAFATADGQAITTDNVSLNVSDRSFFKEAMSGSASVSNIVFDKLDGESINVCAVPLYHGSTLEGIIFATNHANLFSELIQLGILDGKSSSYIIRSDGIPVISSSNLTTHTPPSSVFDALFATAPAAALAQAQHDIAQGQDGVMTYKEDGTIQLAAYTKIGVSDWYLLTIAPRDALAVNSDLLVLRSVVSVLATLFIMGGMLLIILLQARRSNQQLAQLAFSDPLTGGNNLNRFKSLLTQAMSENNLAGLYLLRIDIDNFKLINDMYGYEEGNQVLLGMNTLLASMLTPNEVLSRIGNDTFLCLLHGESNEELLARDEQFREAYRQTLVDAGKHYVVNFTCGLYRIPLSSQKSQLRDVEAFIDRATMAHRSAKLLQSERKVTFYSDNIRDQAIRVKNVEDSMYPALKHGEFSVFLQPKYNLTTGRMEGAEALIRWLRNGKVLSPADFIPVFEKNGFIVNIDLFVLKEVCRLQRRWLDLGLRPVPISVNQSKPLVYSKDYVRDLHNTVKRFHLPPSLIELELLENLIHENIGELVRITESLHDLGFLICIDDFGSGYSSLNMIKDLRADVLKVDREFLSNAESNERAEIVLRNIIDLAKDLQMSVVTEGVETEVQANLLRRLGCHTAQGFLFARPMPSAAFEDILRLVLAQDTDPALLH